jgi:hypothetical protein
MFQLARSKRMRWRSAREEHNVLALRPSALLDISHWNGVCDLTLTLKQARKSDDGRWVEIDEHQCRRAFRAFMNRLNRAVYGNAVKRHDKRLRVIPVLERGVLRVRDKGFASEFGNDLAGRWHIHCAIEPPAHLDFESFERRISDCWSRTDWGYRRIVFRGDADRGWVDYMLKPWQKSGFDAWSDCIDWENLHNPIADA